MLDRRTATGRRSRLARWLIAIGLALGCTRGPAGASDAGALADQAGDLVADGAAEVEVDGAADVGEPVDLVDVADDGQDDGVDAPDVATEVGADADADGGADVIAAVEIDVDTADTDALADVIDASGDAALDAVDAASDATADVPNWKGVPYSACSPGPYAPVAAADPTCKASCPAPYPCTCGTCAWLPTPKTTIPRYQHSAVWTGKYVVVVGSYHPGVPSQAAKMTGERWDPKSGKGFEPIPIEQPASSSAGWAVTLAWTGQDVLMFPNNAKFPWLRYDPASNTAKPLAFSANVMTLYQPVVIAGKVLFSGNDLTVYDDASETGQALKIPSELLEPGVVVWGSNCTAADGDYFYVYDPAVSGGKGKKWKNGIPIEAGAILRLHVPTMKWEVLALAANPQLRCPIGPPQMMVSVTGDTIAVGGAYSGVLQYRMAIGSLANQGWGKESFFNYAMRDSSPGFLRLANSLLVPGQLNRLPGSLPGFSQYPGHAVLSAPLAFDLLGSAWHQLPPWGQPTDGRTETAVVITDEEVLVLGGRNGPSWANFVHEDGFRFPLKALPTGGYP